MVHLLDIWSSVKSGSSYEVLILSSKVTVLEHCCSLSFKSFPQTEGRRERFRDLKPPGTHMPRPTAGVHL